MEELIKKVLVADDELMTRELIATVLSAKGYLCETTADGQEAFKRINSESFDAVITDIVMPNLDGITLTKEIMKINPSMPIMVITGFSDESYYEDAIKAGAKDFINKPFSTAELAARFQRMMRDNEIILKIKEHETEIEKISHDMIAGLQNDARAKIDALKCEIETLNKKLSSRN
jgi:DNA-binding response OmpR family regulator